MSFWCVLCAGMRQLWSMGWCHNRVRVVASHFLVKHLLLPWQWGLKHLWDCQIDADLECDALGWQYVSGCLSGAPTVSDRWLSGSCCVLSARALARSEHGRLCSSQLLEGPPVCAQF